MKTHKSANYLPQNSRVNDTPKESFEELCRLVMKTWKSSYGKQFSSPVIMLENILGCANRDINPDSGEL